MENVLPHHDIREQFQDISTQWGMDPIVVDAADGQVTSRPRLWWLDADWKHASHQLTGSTPFTLHWTLQDGYHRLHNPIATTFHTRERLGDSCNTLPQTTIPSPHHTSSHRPRATTTSPCTSRRSHMGKMATRQQTIPTVAIPTTVSHSPTRRRLATNHTITTRTTHGSTRQLHQDYRPTSINSNKKHHVGQRLAFPISTLASHITTDDSFQPSTPQPTYTV